MKKPVACVGSLNDPGQMEEIIASGQADIVEIGRALLADPYLPKRWKAMKKISRPVCDATNVLVRQVKARQSNVR